ncbi:unnamed protein product [Protopolystoma xenopodis]|uniref:Uncharacterized protein n=1 Tax=Protopolystoma xenopodis TaxID=117903 RepID=A0A448XE88_9PLAT|nr:unnamed protein product [Protopolystoma xenopodis]
MLSADAGCVGIYSRNRFVFVKSRRKGRQMLTLLGPNWCFFVPPTMQRLKPSGNVILSRQTSPIKVERPGTLFGGNMNSLNRND